MAKKGIVKRRIDLLERMARKTTFGAIFRGSPCWLWQGKRIGKGYGGVGLSSGRHVLVHRLAYELLVGPIGNLEIDHLCRVRNCWNPNHLERVTHQENILRGDTFQARNRAKTHCPKGHPLSGDNLVPSKLKQGCRNCLSCSREKSRKYYLEHKEEVVKYQKEWRARKRQLAPVR